MKIQSLLSNDQNSQKLYIEKMYEKFEYSDYFQ